MKWVITSNNHGAMKRTGGTRTGGDGVVRLSFVTPWLLRIWQSQIMHLSVKNINKSCSQYLEWRRSWVILVSGKQPTGNINYKSSSRLSSNSLSFHVTSAATPTVFRNHLKTYLFSRSFPNCFQFLVLYTVYSSGLAVLYSGHSK